MARALVLALATAVFVSSAAPAADDPGHRRALEHYRKGKALMRAESWAEAEPELRAAVRLNPLLVMAHYDLGQTRMALKRYPEAVEAYLECQKAYRASSADNEAGAQDLREDQIRTLQDDIRLIQIDMAMATVGASQRQRLAFRVLRLEGQIDSLKRLRGVRGQPLDTAPELSLALGSAYFRAGDTAAAERAYAAAVAIDPKLGEAHNNLAVIYMMSGRLEEAQKAVKLAEKGGVHVNPDLKKDLDARRKAAAP